MSCVYSGFHGECQLWEEGEQRPGCSDDGYCICEEDPDPGITCEDYEDADQED